MRFNLLAQDGVARRGRLEFPRGTVETPAFMPVGTYGTVKAMTPEDLEEIGVEIILGNTFHLYLRPGIEVIEAHQGLHRFMHWRRPILTDSGGFQVWSLAEMRKITEEGAHFRSPVDGAPVFLSPEESMRIQRSLGADVAMSFDECTPYPATEAEARASMELSMRWALRGFREYYGSDPPGTLFGIVQGGIHLNLRLSSLAALEETGFEGLAIGGLAVGEPSLARRGARGAGAANAASQTALSHGSGTARRHSRGGQARHRHVRLRDADPACAKRASFHPLRRGQYPQLRTSERHGADRSGLCLLHLPALQPQLFAASGQMR